MNRDKASIGLMVAGLVAVIAVSNGTFGNTPDPMSQDEQACQAQLGLSDTQVVVQSAKSFHKANAYTRCIDHRQGQRLMHP